MVFSLAEQRRLTSRFLSSAIADMETATSLVIQETGRKMANEIKKQLRTNFKVKRSGFAKAVKFYYFKPSGPKPASAYVRLGISWLSVFEDGVTVTGRKGWLIILLPQGEALGFSRINWKRWDYTWEKIKDKTWLKPVKDGVIVLLKNGTGYAPIYKLQRGSVRVSKRLSFYNAAESLADGMDSAIADLVG